MVGDLSDVSIGELMSDWNGEFSAIKKSSSRTSAYRTGVTLDCSKN